MYAAIPVYRHDNGEIVLRNYTANNEPWVPSKRGITLSSEDIAKILDASNKAIYSVEYSFEDCMPLEMKMLADKHLPEDELLTKVMEMRRVHNSVTLSEIVITPVYQKIEGFPKTYTADHSLVRVLEMFSQSVDTPSDEWMYA